ncbi:hypothetical protein V493_04305 [Pseudogymnoascus sp. VKM F-4281 (FW-2241)]|nr:hypothetical protein V493_04305 [Pseudogymnoascus sp. VKM F-4281 (FW-2241)]
MGRVNRKRAPASFNYRHRSTRVHRATRFRAFGSVLKCIERLPVGFMKKLKWFTPRADHHCEASQSSVQVLSKEYVASHADRFGNLLVGNGVPRSPKEKQQAPKHRLIPKTRIYRHDARKHSPHRPNYMGISPAILLGMMIKIEKVKWKSPTVSGNVRTSNAIMLEAAMSEDSPTMHSVKNIEGIQYALSFLSNLPDNVLPTFVQKNSTLKTFIQRMETQNTDTAPGHTTQPKNDLGIIEQTVIQLQSRGLAKPYLDKLTAYSSRPEASNVDTETLMQKALIDATNSATLTPRPRDGQVAPKADMVKENADERNVPKLHNDTSQKRVGISLEGSRCNPINLENLSLPDDLFQRVPTPFLDTTSNTMGANNRGWFQGQRNFVLDGSIISDMEAPAVCNHAPCMFNTCENSPKKSSSYPFVESDVPGGPEGQHISAPFVFEDKVEGELWLTNIESMGQEMAHNCAEVPKSKMTIYQYCHALQQARLAEDYSTYGNGLLYPALFFEEMSCLDLEFTETDTSMARGMLMDSITEDISDLRNELDYYDIQTLFPGLQLVPGFEEKIYPQPLPVPTKVLEKQIVKEKSSKAGQSGRGSKPTKVSDGQIVKNHSSKVGQLGCGPKRHQLSCREEPQSLHSNLEPEVSTFNGSSKFRSPSPSMSISSESDIFVDCEEEISRVRSSPAKEATGNHPEAHNEEMLYNQLNAGSVYIPQSSKLGSAYASNFPESAERPYSTKTNQASKKQTKVFSKEAAFSKRTLADMQWDSLSDIGLPAEASSQTDMSTDSGSPFAPLSLDSEPMVADGESCPKCDKPYKYKKSLQKHIRICQAAEIPEESPLPKNSCSTCGRLYKKQGNLELHMDCCNLKNNNSQAAEFPQQEMGEKAGGSLVPFPRDSAKTSSGKPLCEACRSEFTSKRELTKHIKAECTALRVQGSYGRRAKNQLGTPLALSFREPLSASDFEDSDVESVTEISSSRFATSMGKHGQNLVRAEKQSSKGNASRMDCGVRKGSLAEQLELMYGPESKYNTPANPMPNTAFNTMEDPALDHYLRTNGARNGDISDMDVSPTPEPKPHTVGRVSKFASSVSSRRQSAKTRKSLDSELIVGGKTPASVSRFVVLEPGLSELQDAKPQPTGRKLFSRTGMSSGLPSKIRDKQASKGFDFDFPALPPPSLPPKAFASHHKGLPKERESYVDNLESLASEVVTIQCPSQVICDDIVKFFGAVKEKGVGRQKKIVSVSTENRSTVKVIVRPGFDITKAGFDESRGDFVESGNRTYIFLQTDPETPEARAGKKHKLELETPDERPVKRRRGWNLTKEGREKHKLEFGTPDERPVKRRRGWYF